MIKDIINFLEKNKFISSITLTILILPLPELLLGLSMLDIFIVFNMLFALTLIFIVFFKEKIRNYYLYSSIINIFIFFNLAVNISGNRLILLKGVEFDRRLIKYFSSLFIGLESENLFKGLIIFSVIIILITVIITKSCTRVSDVAARFTLDAFQVKLMTIEIEYNNGAITEEEAQARKKEVQEESDFLGALDDSSKYVSGYVKIILYIFEVSYIGIILICILRYIFRGESISDSITYFPLIISSGILCMLPSLMLSITMGIIVTRLDYRYEKEINNESEQN
jgi:flagellar biosynthesis protein FlhA